MGITVNLPEKAKNSNKVVSQEEKLQKALDNYIKFCYKHKASKRIRMDIVKSVPLIQETLETALKKYINMDGNEKALQTVSFTVFNKDGSKRKIERAYNRGFFQRINPNTQFIEE